MAIRRVDLQSKDKVDNIMEFIPKGNVILPNTSGARNADEAARIARIGRAMGCGNWVKIEVIWDSKYGIVNIYFQTMRKLLRLLKY